MTSSECAKSKFESKYVFLIFLVAILAVCMVAALMLGDYKISVSKIISVLALKLFDLEASGISKMDQIVVFDIRMPRILTAAIIGFALSNAGAVYQACFRNPLVEPFILGASSGAALGAAFGIIFAGFFLSITASAFMFSLLAVFLSYTLARNGGIVPVVGLILSGVIVGSIFSAGVSIIKYVSEDAQLREITFWMMGGLYYSKWDALGEILAVVAVCFAVLSALSWKLNLLSLGDNQAKSLGINPEKYKFIFIVIATLMTATCVANVGIIAWIGLIMPHVARLLIGPDNRWVLPIAGLLGGIYLLICDTLARTITMAEIPVGIITSLVGAPFLIVLLRSKAKELLK